jgi:hypothetical protein
MPLLYTSEYTQEKDLMILRECGRWFRQSVDNTVHQKVHFGERLYECEEAKKVFVPKISIIHHHIFYMEIKPVILVGVARDLAKELS